MQTLLALHLLFAGLWLGCVLTEALFERALLAIAANLWCVVLVFRRLTAARGGDAAEFSWIDHRQHQ